jgi:hypothetical protein
MHAVKIGAQKKRHFLIKPQVLTRASWFFEIHRKSPYHVP